jgi:very-short-patch-repair endonuclease
MSGDPRDEIYNRRRVGGPVHVKLARGLRNNSSATERRVWTWLRMLRRRAGFHFRRQVPIGRFVADFGCHAARLIIELDGPFHDAEADAARDAWFAKAGYQTLRFPNKMVVEQWDRVTAEVEFALGIGAKLEGPLSGLQTPSPDPSPQGGGER